MKGEHVRTLVTFCLLALLIGYVAMYCRYSGLHRWLVSGERDVWCLARYPGGLMSIQLALRIYRHVCGQAPPGELSPREEWAIKERRMRKLFYPCLALDQALTDRTYWPGSGKAICH